jgi:8-oxo-dGTP pyrophosphatase MutT (NUDIX family)
VSGGDGARHSADPEQTAVRMQRVAAYAIVLAAGRLLLTQLSERTPAPGRWVLPGGGVDHGEAPLDAVVREVYEETGHRLRDVRLLDVGSHRFTGRAPSGRLEDFHGIQVVYSGQVERVLEPRVVEVGGSTSDARWVGLAELPALDLGDRARFWIDRLLGLATS